MRRRYAMELRPGMVRVLNGLMETEGVDTWAEVFRRAVALLHVARAETADGEAKLAVIRRDGAVLKVLELQ